jgi:hypothetical protein
MFWVTQGLWLDLPRLGIGLNRQAGTVSRSVCSNSLIVATVLGPIAFADG